MIKQEQTSVRRKASICQKSVTSPRRMVYEMIESLINAIFIKTLMSRTKTSSTRFQNRVFNFSLRSDALAKSRVEVTIVWRNDASSLSKHMISIFKRIFSGFYGNVSMSIIQRTDWAQMICKSNSKNWLKQKIGGCHSIYHQRLNCSYPKRTQIMGIVLKVQKNVSRN